MKTIGLIGGLTWESTVEYYRIINELVSRRLGGTHSARILMLSFDFQEFDEHMKTGEWASIGEKVSDAAKIVEKAGADLFLICSNTIHKVAEAAAGTVAIPLLHIADTTAVSIRERNSQWKKISTRLSSRKNTESRPSFPMKRTGGLSTTSSMKS